MWKARIGFRQHPHQRAVKHVRDRDGGDASHGGQRQTLGDELADEASATCAERQAQGDFGFARGAAREQKVGQVRARDQQQHADRRQQRGQRMGEFLARRRRATRAPAGSGDADPETRAGVPLTRRRHRTIPGRPERPRWPGLPPEPASRPVSVVRTHGATSPSREAYRAANRCRAARWAAVAAGARGPAAARWFRR